LGKGYYVSTVGRDEALVRQYIRDQEKEDQRVDQLNFFNE
jgi:putative transposase